MHSRFAHPSKQAPRIERTLTSEYDVHHTVNTLGQPSCSPLAACCGHLLLGRGNTQMSQQTSTDKKISGVASNVTRGIQK